EPTRDLGLQLVELLFQVGDLGAQLTFGAIHELAHGLAGAVLAGRADEPAGAVPLQPAEPGAVAELAEQGAGGDLVGRARLGTVDLGELLQGAGLAADALGGVLDELVEDALVLGHDQALTFASFSTAPSASLRMVLGVSASVTPWWR